MRLAGEGADDRQGSGKEPVPSVDLLQPVAVERGVIRGRIDGFLQALEVLRAVVHMRLDLVAQESGGQLAQLELGAEMLFTHSRQENTFHRAQVAQPAQPLESGSAADPQTNADVVDAERLGRGEKKPVNLGDGTRQGKDRSCADKERDGLHLELAEGANSPFGWILAHSRDGTSCRPRSEDGVRPFPCFDDGLRSHPE